MITYCIFAGAVTILAIQLLYLSVSIIRCRQKHQVPYSHQSDDRRFMALISAQRNFTDYTPFALVLMLTLTRLEVGLWFYGIVVAMFVVGRCVHTYGLLVMEQRDVPSLNGRKMGMLLTFASIVLLIVMMWLYAHA